MSWLWEKATEAVKRFVGASAVLYVLGFLVFRARMNALGVPASHLTLVDQTYLVAGGELIVRTLELLAWSLWWLTALAALAMVGGGAVAARLRRAPRFARGSVLMRVAFAVVALGAFAFALKVAAHILQPASGAALAVGPPEDGPISYALLSLSAVVGAVLLRGAFVTPALVAAPSVVQVGGSVLATLTALVLPMSFGVALRPSDYPVATVEIRDRGPSAPAFLLFSNDKSAVTYAVVDGVRLVPADRVLSITIACQAKLAEGPHCENTGKVDK